MGLTSIRLRERLGATPAPATQPSHVPLAEHQEALNALARRYEAELAEARTSVELTGMQEVVKALEDASSALEAAHAKTAELTSDRDTAVRALEAAHAKTAELEQLLEASTAPAPASKPPALVSDSAETAAALSPPATAVVSPTAEVTPAAAAAPPTAVPETPPKASRSKR